MDNRIMDWHCKKLLMSFPYYKNSSKRTLNCLPIIWPDWFSSTISTQWKISNFCLNVLNNICPNTILNTLSMPFKICSNRLSALSILKNEKSLLKWRKKWFLLFFTYLSFLSFLESFLYSCLILLESLLPS